MVATSAGIAAVALVLGLTLRKFGLARKAILPCIAVAGLGATGIFGHLLRSASATLNHAVGSVTAWAFGVAVPVALLIVMIVSLAHHQRSGTGGGKLAVVSAFLFFPLCAAAGGIFGWLALTSADLLGQIGPTLGSILDQAQAR